MVRSNTGRVVSTPRVLADRFERRVEQFKKKREIFFQKVNQFSEKRQQFEKKVEILNERKKNFLRISRRKLAPRVIKRETSNLNNLISGIKKEQKSINLERARLLSAQKSINSELKNLREQKKNVDLKLQKEIRTQTKGRKRTFKDPEGNILLIEDPERQQSILPSALEEKLPATPNKVEIKEDELKPKDIPGLTKLRKKFQARTEQLRVEKERSLRDIETGKVDTRTALGLGISSSGEGFGRATTFGLGIAESTAQFFSEPKKVTKRTGRDFFQPIASDPIGRLGKGIEATDKELRALEGKPAAAVLPGLATEASIFGLTEFGAAKVVTKGIGLARTVGRRRFDIDDVIDPQILTGRRKFPTTPGRKALEAEAKAAGLPGEKEVRLFSASEVPLRTQEGFLTVGKGASEIPGLFTAPKVSTQFLRLGKNEKLSLFGTGLFPKVRRPTVSAIKPRDIKQAPGGLGQFGRAREFLQTTPKKDVAFIPFVKTEKELLIPPATQPAFKETGTAGFFTFKGQRVPIIKFDPISDTAGLTRRAAGTKKGGLFDIFGSGSSSRVSKDKFGIFNPFSVSATSLGRSRRSSPFSISSPRSRTNSNIASFSKPRGRGGTSPFSISSAPSRIGRGSSSVFGIGSGTGRGRGSTTTTIKPPGRPRLKSKKTKQKQKKKTTRFAKQPRQFGLTSSLTEELFFGKRKKRRKATPRSKKPRQFTGLEAFRLR